MIDYALNLKDIISFGLQLLGAGAGILIGWVKLKERIQTMEERQIEDRKENDARYSHLEERIEKIEQAVNSDRIAFARFEAKFDAKMDEVFRHLDRLLRKHDETA